MSEPPPRRLSDFDRYLESVDAQKAELWQLQALCALRRAMGDRPLSQVGYARIRATLAAETEVKRFRSTRNAQAWLTAEGFVYSAAKRAWMHADRRRATVERRATSSRMRYVRVCQE